MDYTTILNMEPIDLIEWLHTQFQVRIPLKIESAEDMDAAASLMLVLSGYKSYLLELLSYAKCVTRIAKRDQTKMDYEDMVDRKDAIQNMVDDIDQQYKAVSRAVTIRIENNQELKMSEYRKRAE